MDSRNTSIWIQSDASGTAVESTVSPFFSCTVVPSKALDMWYTLRPTSTVLPAFSFSPAMSREHIFN